MALTGALGNLFAEFVGELLKKLFGAHGTEHFIGLLRCVGSCRFFTAPKIHECGLGALLFEEMSKAPGYGVQSARSLIASS